MMQIFVSLILTIGMEPKQVEKVFTANPPDPIEMEKAKKMLKVGVIHFLNSSFILSIFNYYNNDSSPFEM